MDALGFTGNEIFDAIFLALLILIYALGFIAGQQR